MCACASASACASACACASVPSGQPPVDLLAATLRDKFSHAGFRGQQRDVIEAVLAGRDALVVWPTDRGKSLCYQLSAVR